MAMQKIPEEVIEVRRAAVLSVSTETIETTSKLTGRPRYITDVKVFKPLFSYVGPYTVYFASMALSSLLKISGRLAPF